MLAYVRAQKLGDFGYFYAYMSQPKSQLETFKSWAGKESDISFYLNSHHVDICDFLTSKQRFKPIRVTASSVIGTAVELGCHPQTEDTITLLVDYVKEAHPTKRATAVFTASWTAPQKAGVHSNQYFHYMASGGEIRINQGKRGYEFTTDEGLIHLNPFYVQYAPDEEGNFNGNAGSYGYKSIEKFIEACRLVNDGRVSLEELDRRNLPTIANTIITTAILEAGRRSLDQKRSIEIVHDKSGSITLK